MSATPIPADYWEHPESATLVTASGSVQTYTPPTGKIVVGIQSTALHTAAANVTKIYETQTLPNEAPFGTITGGSTAHLSSHSGIIKGRWTQLGYSANGTQLTTLIVYLADA